MSDELNINYTREAFMNPINLGVLLVSTLTAFFMTGMGDFSSLLLTSVFGLELMYLGIVPKLPRFRKKLELKKIKERHAANNEKELFQSLDNKSQKRFLVLKHLAKLVQENFEKLPYSSQGLLDNIGKKIDELLGNYLTLLDLIKRYEVYLNTSLESSLKEEVIRQIEEIKTLESEKLKRTKARRVAIMQKRLKKFNVAKEKYLVCETHLETIEDAVRYIYEQSMTMSNPEEIGFQLDNLLTEVEETSQLIDDLDQDILPEYTTEWENDLDFDSILDELSDEVQTEIKPAKKVKE
ncbi:MAG: hypothetical protein JJ953_12475 [Gracilimonas sp.]|uniref:hypothetical protein n=1 Tax=Gracilimonas TaxID=649462 RepID=UPI001B07FB93|nr:hypothetical protein [Gracilimonas sp.]MBO6586915.1 hypothetical protein [Gracilimonas sp.]MBO6614597.1 hypothetical protein [Gracilimonas sp.]